MIDRRELLLAGIGLSVVPRAAWCVAPSSIDVAHPWAPPTEARLGVAYMALTRTGSDGDQLVGAETPLSERVEIRNAAGEASHWLNLAPGRAVMLQPGGAYLALVGLKTPLIAGAVVPLTLRFAVAGEVIVRVPVEAAP